MTFLRCDYCIYGTVRSEQRGRASVDRYGRIRVRTPTQTLLARQEHIEAYQATLSTSGLRRQCLPGHHSRGRCKNTPIDTVTGPSQGAFKLDASKLVLDSLNGLAYRDDSHVIRINVEKHWAEADDCDQVRVSLFFHWSATKPKPKAEPKKRSKK